ncbi:hypothetical protein M8818_007730 [Zalaria obscura]|uniref:Uncharacterized protein n=1 Tax=Zalaria obscura TaxID=2024903 RepID=A0ACC3S3F6_9PEZI
MASHTSSAEASTESFDRSPAMEALQSNLSGSELWAMQRENSFRRTLGKFNTGSRDWFRSKLLGAKASIDDMRTSLRGGIDSDPHIRSLKDKLVRKATLKHSSPLSRGPQEEEEEPAPTDSEASSPRPSSPIDIPNQFPAPSIDVDIESADLSPGSILTITGQNESKQSLHDCRNSTEQRVSSIPQRMSTHRWKRREYRRPGAVASDDTEPESNPIAQTPMPGTNMPLEDPFADSANDPFERSVDKTVQTLERRPSLDALVLFDGALDSTQLDEAFLSPPGIPVEEPSVTQPSPTDSAGKEVPPSRQDLSERIAALRSPSAGHTDVVTGEWVSDDPFAVAASDPTRLGSMRLLGIGNVGPPSPERRIVLPYRPKVSFDGSPPSRGPSPRASPTPKSSPKISSNMSSPRSRVRTTPQKTMSHLTEGQGFPSRSHQKHPSFIGNFRDMSNIAVYPSSLTDPHPKPKPVVPWPPRPEPDDLKRPRSILITREAAEPTPDPETQDLLRCIKESAIEDTTGHGSAKSTSNYTLSGGEHSMEGEDLDPDETMSMASLDFSPVCQSPMETQELFFPTNYDDALERTDSASLSLALLHWPMTIEGVPIEGLSSRGSSVGSDHGTPDFAAGDDAAPNRFHDCTCSLRRKLAERERQFCDVFNLYPPQDLTRDPGPCGVCAAQAEDPSPEYPSIIPFERNLIAHKMRRVRQFETSFGVHHYEHGESSQSAAARGSDGKQESSAESVSTESEQQWLQEDPEIFGMILGWEKRHGALRGSSSAEGSSSLLSPVDSAVAWSVADSVHQPSTQAVPSGSGALGEGDDEEGGIPLTTFGENRENITLRSTWSQNRIASLTIRKLELGSEHSTISRPLPVAKGKDKQIPTGRDVKSPPRNSLFKRRNPVDLFRERGDWMMRAASIGGDFILPPYDDFTDDESDKGN